MAQNMVADGLLQLASRFEWSFQSSAVCHSCLLQSVAISQCKEYIAFGTITQLLSTALSGRQCRFVLFWPSSSILALLLLASRPSGIHWLSCLVMLKHGPWCAVTYFRCSCSNGASLHRSHGFAYVSRPQTIRGAEHNIKSVICTFGKISNGGSCN